MYVKNLSNFQDISHLTHIEKNIFFVISAHFSNISVVLEKGLPLFFLEFYKANFDCSDRDT